MRASTLFKPAYNYLLFTAIVIVITSSIYHESIDFHLHDTYFVIAAGIILKVFAAVLFFIWGIYYSLRDILLAKWLTWLHVISILVWVIAMFTANFWYHPVPLSNGKGYVTYNDLVERNKREVVIFLPLILTFLAGQLAFFINTIGGCIKYLIKKNR